MSETTYLWSLIAVTAGVTLLLRAFPFLLFGSAQKTPPVIEYIGKVLSPAAIAMLVVYCFGCYFRDRPILQNYYGAAELIAAAVVVGLQLWRKNPLLSIICGTAIYMVLVQNF
ncbi:MAG: AzlD domain-containing protein [Lentisphaeria bacterium]|nr:AzlD domain-containing protein [Lentisphaeria bacterium]MBQ7404583.1 AzlD domain-containing protein [Lentisphaeria bacterium]